MSSVPTCSSDYAFCNPIFVFNSRTIPFHGCFKTPSIAHSEVEGERVMGSLRISKNYLSHRKNRLLLETQYLSQAIISGQFQHDLWWQKNANWIHLDGPYTSAVRHNSKTFLIQRSTRDFRWTKSAQVSQLSQKDDELTQTALKHWQVIKAFEI